MHDRVAQCIGQLVGRLLDHLRGDWRLAGVEGGEFYRLGHEVLVIGEVIEHAPIVKRLCIGTLGASNQAFVADPPKKRSRAGFST